MKDTSSEDESIAAAERVHHVLGKITNDDVLVAVVIGGLDSRPDVLHPTHELDIGVERDIHVLAVKRLGEGVAFEDDGVGGVGADSAAFVEQHLDGSIVKLVLKEVEVDKTA